MSIVAYSHQDEYDLTNSAQDCRGWTVVDQAGNQLGTVTELLIDTDKGHVDSIIISGSGAQVPAADIALRDGRVVVRGVMHQQESARTEQVTTTTTTAQSYAPAQRETNARHVAGLTRAAADDEISIPIIEEQLAVGKRTVESGGVRVRSHVTETPVQEQVTLREETVHVERTPVNRPVSQADLATGFREGEITMTERDEVAVVAKEAHVVEEVTIGKNVTERVETVSDTVRRTDVEVEEITGDDKINRHSNR